MEGGLVFPYEDDIGWVFFGLVYPLGHRGFQLGLVLNEQNIKLKKKK